MRDMASYCRYLFRLVEPALGTRVWEVGVGHGNYTRLLRAAGRSVLATDIDDDCLAQVGAYFEGDCEVQTARVDLTDQASVRAQAHFGADSIMSLNVLEHIDDDVAALTWLRESAGSQARIGLIVPALPGLYGRMDREAGHFRRYTRRSLRLALEHAGWLVTSTRYVNLLGALGWWYHNRVRQHAGLNDATVNRQMRRVDGLLPAVARVSDPVCGWIAGLSVAALGIANE